MLIVEAGPKDHAWDWRIHMPSALQYNLASDRYNWYYTVQPQKYLDDRCACFVILICILSLFSVLVGCNVQAKTLQYSCEVRLPYLQRVLCAVYRFHLLDAYCINFVQKFKPSFDIQQDILRAS